MPTLTYLVCTYGQFCDWENIHQSGYNPSLVSPAQSAVLPGLRWPEPRCGGGGEARGGAGQGGGRLQEVGHRPGRLPLLARVQTGAHTHTQFSVFT